MEQKYEEYKKKYLPWPQVVQLVRKMQNKKNFVVESVGPLHTYEGLKAVQERLTKKAEELNRSGRGCYEVVTSNFHL